MHRAKFDRTGAVAPRLIAFLLLFVLGGCGPKHAAGPAWFDAAPSPLRPGDAIGVYFSLEPQQTGTYPVDERGEVGLPFLGRLFVTTTPPDSLRDQLIRQYEAQLRNQTVEVRLLRRVRVLGAVRQPGLYHVDSTMMLGDVVAKAGGATEEGRLEDTRVVRGETELRADLSAGAGAFQVLRSGDQVFVPRKNWFVRNAAVLAGGALSAVGLIVASAAF